MRREFRRVILQLQFCHPQPLEDNAEGGEKAKLFKRTSSIVSDAQNATHENVIKSFH